MSGTTGGFEVDGHVEKQLPGVSAAPEASESHLLQQGKTNVLFFFFLHTEEINNNCCIKHLSEDVGL